MVLVGLIFLAAGIKAIDFLHDKAIRRTRMKKVMNEDFFSFKRRRS